MFGLIATFLRTLFGPGALVGIGLLLSLLTGIGGAWWGLSSGAEERALWKARAENLQTAAQNWERLAKADSEQALSDAYDIETVTKILDKAKHHDQTHSNSIPARWSADDIRLFRHLQNHTPSR
ncbi:MAG: hypothetical protein AAF228_04720 [Pseudomonadota bacterium]